MAKTIKFNLTLDGMPVRTLEGVRENFSIEDILGYYENGLLARWLKVRGFESELEAVKNINKEESIKNKIKELVKIFNIETDDDVIDKGLEIVEYSKLFRELNAIYAQQAYDKKLIIEDYHKGYDMLINHIIENKENMAVLKASAQYLESEYYELFKLESGPLFERLKTNAPKAIYVLLMFESFRAYWIGNYTRIWLYETIKQDFLQPDKAKAILGDDLKSVARDTDGVFDEIESEDKKVMLISMGSYAYARGVDKFGQKLSSNEVNGKLPILNGLLFNCAASGRVTLANRELLYVEV